MIFAQNKKVNFEYFIEEKLEAGLVLEGWEVKAIRARQAQINDAHIIIREGEFYLINAHIKPLKQVSTHITPEASRNRKLLLNKKQINKWIGKVQQKGNTVVVLNLHLTAGKIKAEVALAKGKKNYDKRQSLKEKDINREAARSIKQYL